MATELQLVSFRARMLGASISDTSHPITVFIVADGIPMAANILAQKLVACGAKVRFHPAMSCAGIALVFVVPCASWILLDIRSRGCHQGMCCNACTVLLTPICIGLHLSSGMIFCR